MTKKYIGKRNAPNLEQVVREINQVMNNFEALARNAGGLKEATHNLLESHRGAACPPQELLFSDAVWLLICLVLRDKNVTGLGFGSGF